jgi:hypothetical protein
MNNNKQMNINANSNNLFEKFNKIDYSNNKSNRLIEKKEKFEEMKEQILKNTEISISNKNKYYHFFKKKNDNIYIIELNNNRQPKNKCIDAKKITTNMCQKCPSINCLDIKTACETGGGRKKNKIKNIYTKQKSSYDMVKLKNELFKNNKKLLKELSEKDFRLLKFNSKLINPFHTYLMYSLVPSELNELNIKDLNSVVEIFKKNINKFVKKKFNKNYVNANSQKDLEIFAELCHLNISIFNNNFNNLHSSTKNKKYTKRLYLINSNNELSLLIKKDKKGLKLKLGNNVLKPIQSGGGGNEERGMKRGYSSIYDFEDKFTFEDGKFIFLVGSSENSDDKYVFKMTLLEDENNDQYLHESDIYDYVQRNEFKSSPDYKFLEYYGRNIKNPQNNIQNSQNNIQNSQNNSQEKEIVIDMRNGKKITFKNKMGLNLPGYCLQVTEFNCNYILYSKYLEDNLSDTNKLIDIMKNVLDIKKKLFDDHKFVHWDFHNDNLFINTSNSKHIPVFFDFDLSTIKIEGNLFGTDFGKNDIYKTNKEEIIKGIKNFNKLIEEFKNFKNLLSSKISLLDLDDNKLIETRDKVFLELGLYDDEIRFLFDKFYMSNQAEFKI